MQRTLVSVALVSLLTVASCSSGGDDVSESSGSVVANTDDPSPSGSTSAPVAGDPAVTEPPATEPPPEPADTDPSTGPETDPPAGESPVDDPGGVSDVSGARARNVVTVLASDELMGRDDETEASLLAQDFLVAELETFAEPAVADGYRQDYGNGTNLIAIVPGSDLADEYVLVGGHYDHLGTDCRGISPDDNICNGATDNAAGVAAALEVARAVATAAPRRSVVIALWDGEEDGLVGSRRYVEDPAVPLAGTVAYLNFDIQGSNLVPSLAASTIMVGAETGGQQLIDAALAATTGSPLTTANFSIIFGQGRSDHANLAAAGVPSVFFTDANNGCYHTVKDDLNAVDFGKLDMQIANATTLALDLASTNVPPVFVPDAPLTVHNDAVELLTLVAAAEPDFALLGADGASEAIEFLAVLEGIVTAGAQAYDDAAIAQVLGGAVTFVERLANSECQTGG